MNGEYGWFSSIIRSLFSFFDRICYWLLSGIYNIFFTVSTAEIFAGDVITNFYSRVQLILGVFMIFKLSFSILGFITNPESVNDKQKGAGKVLMRIAVSLVMLTLVVPINIPAAEAPAGSLNAQIKNHGILFGFLYQFQTVVMQDNVLGKLILGSTTASNVDANGNVDNSLNGYGDAGGTLAATVAKAFFRPALTEDENNVTTEDIKNKDIYVCPEVYQYYNNDSVDAQSLMDNINYTCVDNDGNEMYAFNYTILLGMICAALMAFIILGFTIDVAVRAVKLAVLRLIAPIPIISYISPGSEKDGAFGNWVKNLTSTYIDLFIRIAIIYFGTYVIILISESFKPGSGIELFPTSNSWITTILAGVFIIIGVLFFMKQAPQFLKNALGIKGTPMSNIGLSGLLGGAAMAIGGGGLAGFGLGAMQGMTAAGDAAAQGKGASPFQAWSANRDQMAKIRTGDKDARGGIVGGAMDRMLYNTRERSLAAKGLTYANVDTADKAAKDHEKNVLKPTQLERDLAWENLKNMGVTSDPGEAMGYDDYYDKVYSKETPDMSPDAAYAEYQQRHNERKAAWDRFATANTNLERETKKQKDLAKSAKYAQDARDALGTTPRMQDNYGRGYRAGGNGQKFTPGTSENVTTKSDDTGIDRIAPEIGGSN